MSDEKLQVKPEKLKEFIKNEIQDFTIGALVAASINGSAKVMIYWDEKADKFNWECVE